MEARPYDRLDQLFTLQKQLNQRIGVDSDSMLPVLKNFKMNSLSYPKLSSPLGFG